ncbi:hypothetical protein [Pectinatus haikarae]|uniref:Uncharacterized protein n=1 Tax=Pectinatus haikarae TaxID=349096 RepID=A0ABT9Y6D3_9FIRM|nr:hypothetical protein [Pectinatus haikarae]MDQ0203387.1 hypothetical protein [Pectinatus haikarae]
MRASLFSQLFDMVALGQSCYIEQKIRIRAAGVYTGCRMEQKAAACLLPI